MRRRTLLSSSGGIDPTTGRGMIGDYEVVDLGLSNGLLFATCNVGATNETDYGDYYKYGYGSQQYESSTDYYEGYEEPLASSADTATQVMGSGWRMPTKTELQDLIDNTDYEFVTNFNGSGIDGGKFTSKTNPNAYVFFPANGVYEGGSLDYEYLGYYWSSTPYDDSDKAYYLGFQDEWFGEVYHGYRYDGMSVRGVHAQPGKPMPPMSVLFVNKNDTTQKEIFKEEDWPSASDWCPIGIVVVPSSHNRYGDGTNGIMSLGCLSSGGTMQTSGATDNLSMPWGGQGTDTPLTNYDSSDGNIAFGYVQYQTDSSSTALSYDDTPNIAYPYTNTTATDHSFISRGCLSDYDGVGNTNILNSSASTYIAAAACKKFNTIGTSVGDWYLPAAGELAYLPSIRYQVNDTITALNTKYGNVGVKLDVGNCYRSSSEYDSTYAWTVCVFNGKPNGFGKGDNYLCVRAFLRF